MKFYFKYNTEENENLDWWDRKYSVGEFDPNDRIQLSQPINKTFIKRRK